MNLRRFGLVTALLLGSTLGFACGETDVGECPADSTETQVRGQQLVVDRCMGCHASTLTGSDRNNAPSNLNFDDLSVVRNEGNELFEEIDAGDMPPSGPLSSADKESIRVWLACGAPDVID
ncbi:MAG: hypothetical protein IPK13_04220 [Deltaproteobacteria bacterium]|nr:hypothetical protein [Deltaproteobacteria bacterium]